MSSYTTTGISRWIRNPISEVPTWTHEVDQMTWSWGRTGLPALGLSVELALCQLFRICLARERVGVGIRRNWTWSIPVMFYIRGLMKQKQTDCANLNPNTCLWPFSVYATTQHLQGIPHTTCFQTTLKQKYTKLRSPGCTQAMETSNVIN